MHQQHVHHRGLVDDEQVAFERIVGIAPEPTALGVDLEQAMDGLSLEPRGFVHALGRTTSGGAQQELDVFRGEDLQNGVDDGGLAHPRPAGNHQDRGRERQSDGILLAVGECQAGALLNPRHRLVRIDRGPRKFALRQSQNSVGNGPLGVMETGKEDSVGLAQTVSHHRAVGQFEIEGCADQALGHLKQLFGQRHQF